MVKVSDSGLVLIDNNSEKKHLLLSSLLLLLLLWSCPINCPLWRILKTPVANSEDFGHRFFLFFKRRRQKKTVLLLLLLLLLPELPLEPPSVEEAFGILAAALKALETPGVGKSEVLRLRCIISGARIYGVLLADYIGYRGLEA
jgi:hypothetical protein